MTTGDSTTSEGGGGQQTVLVVDDDEDLADTYALWLGDEYDVRVAYGGREALEKVDSDVDVALLDRRMPEPSGDEVLEHIRERDDDCLVAMLTAVEPDTDIIDMAFDEYVTKPVDREQLVETVEELLSRAELSEELREYAALSSTLGVLQAQQEVEALDDTEEIETLRDRVESKRCQVEDAIADLEHWESGFREVS